MGWTITDLARNRLTLGQAKDNHVRDATRYCDGTIARIIFHEWHDHTWWRSSASMLQTMPTHLRKYFSEPTSWTAQPAPLGTRICRKTWAHALMTNPAPPWPKPSSNTFPRRRTNGPANSATGRGFPISRTQNPSQRQSTLHHDHSCPSNKSFRSEKPRKP